MFDAIDQYCDSSEYHGNEESVQHQQLILEPFECSATNGHQFAFLLFQFLCALFMHLQQHQIMNTLQTKQH